MQTSFMPDLDATRDISGRHERRWSKHLACLCMRVVDQETGEEIAKEKKAD